MYGVLPTIQFATTGMQPIPVDADQFFRTACMDTVSGLIEASTALIGWPLLLVGGAVVAAGLMRLFDCGGFAAAGGQTDGPHNKTQRSGARNTGTAPTAKAGGAQQGEEDHEEKHDG